MELNTLPRRAVVLAAGRGRRLHPYTETTPKPLLSVNGRPTLSYILEALANAGISQVGLVTHHLAEQIERFIAGNRVWPFEISVWRQESLRGTADALKAAVSLLDEVTLVVAGDYALPPDYLNTLKDAYLAGGTDLAVSLKKLPPDQAGERSSVRFNDGGQICEIVEKPLPGQAPSAIGASLIYIVPPDIRAYLQQETVSARGEFELQAVINRMLADGYTIQGCLQPPPREWSKPDTSASARPI